VGKMPRMALLLLSAILPLFLAMPDRALALAAANPAPAASTEKTVKSRKHYRYRGRTSRKAQRKSTAKNRSKSAHKP